MSSQKPQLLAIFFLPASEGGCSEAHDCARQRPGLGAAEWEEQCVMRHQRPVKKGEKMKKNKN